MWFLEKSDVVVNQRKTSGLALPAVVCCCSHASCRTKTFANTIDRQGLITLTGWQPHQNELGCSFCQSLLSSPTLTHPITVILITLPWTLWSRVAIYFRVLWLYKVSLPSSDRKEVVNNQMFNFFLFLTTWRLKMDEKSLTGVQKSAVCTLNEPGYHFFLTFWG